MPITEKHNPISSQREKQMTDNLAKRIENLDYKELKQVSSLINEAELEGIDKLRVVAVKKDKMVENFTTAVETIAEKHGEDAIPEKALLLFNDLYGEGGTRLDGNTSEASDGDPSKDASAEKTDEHDTVDAAEKAEAQSDKTPAQGTSKKSSSAAKKNGAKAKAKSSAKDGGKKKDASTTKTSSTKKGQKKKKSPPVIKVDKYGTRPDTLARAFVESVKEKPKTMKQIQKEKWNPRGFIFPDTLERLVKAGLAQVDDNQMISITE